MSSDYRRIYHVVSNGNINAVSNIFSINDMNLYSVAKDIIRNYNTTSEVRKIIINYIDLCESQQLSLDIIQGNLKLVTELIAKQENIHLYIEELITFSILYVKIHKKRKC
jgi:hypothetical protein